MLPDTAILLPPVAMVLLTFIVWLRLYSDRLTELRRRKIHPQQLATAYQAAQMLQNVQSSDHFRNLFEVPVLFHALCAFVAISELTTLLLLACAWGFVVLRVLHAYIHLTGNQVVRRFQAYVASSLLLYFMWGVFAVQLILKQMARQ
jgi:hypothetical protein